MTELEELLRRLITERERPMARWVLTRAPQRPPPWMRRREDR